MPGPAPPGRPRPAHGLQQQAPGAAGSDRSSRCQQVTQDTPAKTTGSGRRGVQHHTSSARVCENMRHGQPQRALPAQIQEQRALMQCGEGWCTPSTVPRQLQLKRGDQVGGAQPPHRAAAPMVDGRGRLHAAELCRVPVRLVLLLYPRLCPLGHVAGAL